MKEYNVVTIKGGITPAKIATHAQQALDEMAAQGWELKFITGLLWVFEREKR